MTNRAGRMIALAVLTVAYVMALAAPVITAHRYDEQLREDPDAKPSVAMPLGTDELGRDRWARFVYGSRVSLLLGPAAALVSTGIALLAGVALAFLPRPVEWPFLLLLDLFLALPSVFVLIIARSLLPLNVPPEASLATMFCLISTLGWPGAARAVRAAAISLQRSDFHLQAIAAGSPLRRVVLVHLVPNLRGVILARFLVAVPAFIIAEATLGMLGLGVTEPLPSWGTQLMELANFREISRQPWILTPAACMIVVTWSMNQLAHWEES